MLGEQDQSLESLMSSAPDALPLILPLGDRGLLVRFGDALSEPANRAAIAFGHKAVAAGLTGVEEVVPNLVSVLLRYAPERTDFATLAGEIRLLLAAAAESENSPRQHTIAVRFDGEDLAEVAALLQLTPAAFVAAHCGTPLRVLATGFAPGFVYLGFHPQDLVVPRRQLVRRSVPAGTVLFAAGQTAIASTAIPTGWHVIGTTEFRNFEPGHLPPTQLAAGDSVICEAVA